MFTLLLLIFRVHNQLVSPSNKDAVKEKVNVQSSRDNPLWRQNGSAKVVLFSPF